MHWFQQSHFLLWGSVYMAYLEIQTSDWWSKTCSRLGIKFRTWFQFQILDILTFIRHHITQVASTWAGHYFIHVTSFTADVMIGFRWTSYTSSSSQLGIHCSLALQIGTLYSFSTCYRCQIQVDSPPVLYLLASHDMSPSHMTYTLFHDCHFLVFSLS